ncbi:MAG: hypothetical protein ACC608_09400 [Anaerofustis sp.]
MPIFGTKDKEGNTSINLMMGEGIASIQKGMAINVSMMDDHLFIKQRIGKAAPASLRYDQITNVEIINEKEIIEKGKSVVGRAVLGNIILGPLGALVGGMSGTGSKKKVSYDNYMVINYKSSADEEIKVITFQVVGASMGTSKFLSELKQRANIASVDSTATIEL